MNKYQRNVTELDSIDVYDILNLYGVKSHAVGHAIKKLLMAGQRGAKDYRQDLHEAVQAIQREMDMQTATGEEKRATVDSAPSWNDAPEWAQWLAQSSNGWWYWFAQRPAAMKTVWAFDGGKIERFVMGAENPYWQSTLEQRPE